MSNFAECVVITKVVSNSTELEKYLITSLITEERRAADRASSISIAGNIKLEKWFEDEVTTNELMSHRMRHIVSYGMAEMMRS